jgi:hypothetical protein
MSGRLGLGPQWTKRWARPIDGSGTVAVLPAIAIGPRKMRLDNMGVCVGDYAMDP